MTEKLSISDESPVLVVGTGYLGRSVAALARSSGSPVIATTRDPKRAQRLSEAGLVGTVFDWNRPLNDAKGSLLDKLPLLSDNGRVLISVSYDARAGLSRYEAQVQGLRRLLDILPLGARICYISTTGVYHHRDGRWVDETTPAHPSRPGGRVHLQAEQLFHRLRPREDWSILRLAGIYGPNRVPRVADVRAGKPLSVDPDSYINLIHVHDAARAVIASWQAMANKSERMGLNGAKTVSGLNARRYVVGDDRPVTRGEFYREVARQCRVAEPQFDSSLATTSAASRRAGNKRVSNRKMKRELLHSLRYPDFRSGLADVLASDVR